MGRPKRKHPPPSPQRRPRRFVSKKWDIVGVILVSLMVVVLLVDLADIATHFHGHFHEIYHAAAVLLPLAVVGWIARMLIREKNERKRKR